MIVTNRFLFYDKYNNNSIQAWFDSISVPDSVPVYWLSYVDSLD